MIARPAVSQRASGQSERPATAVFYSVAGRFICVEADDADTASAFARYFDGWHVTRLVSVPRPGDADAIIRVRRGLETPAPPRGFESFEVAEGGVCHTDGGTYFFQCGGSAVRVTDEAPPYVEVWIDEETLGGKGAPLARLIFNASMTAMRRCGLFELHGAGVVSPGGAGVLFVGPSGSGKSTLATQLASAGWRYLSDDSLLITGDGGVAEARALRRVFAVTEPTVAAGVLAGFEDVLAAPAPFDAAKRRFEPQAVFPEGFAPACRPRALFFPTVAHMPESRTRRLSKAETMTRLIRMCPWACYDKPAARAHLSALTLLARQADGFELNAGTDLLLDAECAARLISSRIAGGEV